LKEVWHENWNLELPTCFFIVAKVASKSLGKILPHWSGIVSKIKAQDKPSLLLLPT